MTAYIAILEKEPGTLWGVWFPDLPGCTTAGETAEEASQRATEALRLYAEEAHRQGEPLPSPRPLDALNADREIREALAAGHVAVRVPLLENTGAPVRINVSIDAGSLRAVDDAAQAHGMTRSAFLVTAAKEKILRQA